MTCKTYGFCRNNLPLTRNNLLHTSRNTSNCLRPSQKLSNKSYLRRTLRGRPSICSQSLATSNCKWMNCNILCLCFQYILSMFRQLGSTTTMREMFFLSCSFVGESMHDDSSLVFAYYKEGATDPTFLYFSCGLKEVKC